MATPLEGHDREEAAARTGRRPVLHQERGLNRAQAEAATYLEGPLLVLAGAGTGKTRVVTHRMAEMIRRGTPADRILSVTFTNKAAREMLERTGLLLGRRLRQRPWIGTFHALCVRILRQEAESLGYPRSFAIFDRADQESAARAALREVRLGDLAMKPGDLLARISRWKMQGVRPAEAGRFTEDDRDVLAAVAYRRYQNHLQSSAAFDFDDLLLQAHTLLQEHPRILESQRARFDYVQIDEYQDTNRVQFLIVEALVAGHGRICVVGDDDQSIYGWRGAEVEHILNFQTHFPGAKTVRLEENYRSTDAILGIANNLVRFNRTRHPKRLRGRKATGEGVRFLAYHDEATEAEQLVLEIDYLVKQDLARPEEIAILYRTNEQPRLFETELRRRKLPYLLVGGQSFFDYKEVRDLLAYFRVLANPRDDQAFLRIVNVPARGIGTKSVQRILARSVREGTSCMQAWQALCQAGELPQAARNGLDQLRGVLEESRRRIREHPRKLAQAAERLIERIRYRDEIRKNYSKPGQQMARTAMLDQLIEALREYEARSGEPALSGFLQETTLDGRESGFQQNDQPSRGVRLLTLHSAKGLEFPHVYLVGMEEGLLPHRRSIEGSLAMIEEERRLAYVGVTRAMERLTISRAEHRKKWGKLRPTVPSRFLTEMNEALHQPAAGNGQEAEKISADRLPPTDTPADARTRSA